MRAQFALSRLYFEGLGVSRDVERALHWALAAAEQGHVDAQVAAGTLLHERGELTQAFEWYSRAASQGNADAQVNVAQMLYSGDGAPRDIEGAVYWSEQAAAQGDVPAMIFLAHRYGWNGECENLERAISWNEKAARSGDVGCLMRLVFILGEEESTVYDPARAYRWAYTGTRITDDPKVVGVFEKFCGTFGTAMSERDRHVAIHLAEEWLRAHPQALGTKTS